MFLIPLEVQGHTVPHWKSISNGKYGSGALRWDSCQDILKSNYLLHKRGFVDSQTQIRSKKTTNL